MLNLFSIDTDPATIPSIGPYYIAEYEPGVRVVVVRNPNYWKTDEAGVSLPYLERVIYQIVPDRNTEFLLFKEGNKDAYTLRPEDIDELLAVEDPDFTVYNGGATLGSAFVAFNQNPDTMDALVYSWFSQTEVPPGDELGAQPRPYRQPGVPRAGRACAVLLRPCQPLLRRVDPAALRLQPRPCA